MPKWRNVQMVVLVVGYLDKSHLQHLKQIVVPVSYRYISACSKGLDSVVTSRDDFWRKVSAQNINSQGESYFFSRPEYSRKSLLHEHCSVEHLWRSVTNITVATALVAYLAKIIQQNASATYLCLSIFLHTS